MQHESREHSSNASVGFPSVKDLEAPGAAQQRAINMRMEGTKGDLQMSKSF